MAIIFDNASETRQFIFETGQYYYLFVLLSQATESGSVWSTDPYQLADDIRTELITINGLELRGISTAIVRGSVNSLNIGIVAGFYNGQQNLTQTNASTLRASMVSALNNIVRLAYSEIRIEVTLIQKSTY